MSIEENVKLGNLIDIYGDLLSEKQKLAITRYVNADMSLSEIAQDENITRAGVLDAIQKAKQKLYFYEDKLKLYKIKQSLTQILERDEKSIKNEIRQLLEEI